MRQDYAMETKTSNRCWKSADECTFTALSFSRALEEFRAHFLTCFDACVARSREWLVESERGDTDGLMKPQRKKGQV